MCTIDDCVTNLIDIIKADPRYRRYRQAEETLEADPELMQQVDEFRGASFHFQNDPCEDNRFDRLREFNEYFRDLRKDPRVLAYLKAELEVCRMIRDIYSRLGTEIDFRVMH